MIGQTDQPDTVKQPDINGGRGELAKVEFNQYGISPQPPGADAATSPTLTSHISALQNLHKDMQDTIQMFEDKFRQLNGALPLTNLFTAEKDVSDNIADLLSDIRVAASRMKVLVTSL